MKQVSTTNYNPHRTLFLFLFFVSCFLFFSPQAFAQSASSCVVTNVGNPTSSSPLPPECLITDSGGSPGQYFFPLGTPSVITGISTEMATYGGNYTYGGHVEHAGLDIMTLLEKRVPVYAITDGVVTQSGDHTGCMKIQAGCRIVIQHSTDQLLSIYTHTNPLVPPGVSVKKGDKIGVVHDWPGAQFYGMDHLHFELRQQSTNHNINPRNYFPELQRFPISKGYNGNVRGHAASRGILLEQPVQGKEWAEKFLYHPPCQTRSDCWAH